jgi:hypothetical protein
MVFSLRFGLLMIAFAMLSGCFQVETTVRLNPDGSGTVEEKMLLSNMIIGQMDQMAKAFAPPGGKTKPFSLYDPKKLRKQAAAMGPGVVFVSGKPLVEKGFKGYRATYSFKDINKLVLSSKGAGSMSELPGAKADKEQSLLFRFTPGKQARLVLRQPHPEKKAGTTDSRMETAASEGDTDKPAMTPEQEKTMEEFLKGMKFSLNIVINGTVKETNATFRDGNRITVFEFDPGRMILDAKKLELLKKVEPASPEEAKAILKDIPGIKIELNDPLEVVFTR